MNVHCTRYINKWMNKWKKRWMNEWINECINDWLIDWLNLDGSRSGGNKLSREDKYLANDLEKENEDLQWVFCFWDIIFILKGL